MAGTYATDCPSLPDPDMFGLPPEVAEYMTEFNSVILQIVRDLGRDQDIGLRLGAEGSIAYDDDGGLVARVID